jgi:hypothetical protein
MAPPAI